MSDEVKPPIEPNRLTDAEWIQKWRSEREGTKAWGRDHYARSLRAKATQAEITRANAAAKRRKK
jgi:hypothetical protein